LDNECNAKVSDFGASALKSMDKNDFIILIQGTLGYLDPESFVSHHQTDKSDVYSFEECVQESYITNYLEYNKILLYKKSI
jgi:serine/threonine protein kinase